MNADVAEAVRRYLAATADEQFEQEMGCELLVETARLWASLGNFDADGHFRINGVTGPDEYSAMVDNNVYTNLMAQRNLATAADSAEHQPEAARRLEVGTNEIAAWRAAAQAMYVPFDDSLGVHPQDQDFTTHAHWDFAGTSADEYPLLLHRHYFDLYRKQVVKQADLVMALYARGDAFTADEKHRDFDYYEALTVRDSSLSACVQAIVAAEVGHLDLAYDYFGEAALMDVNDLEHNVLDGVHIASLAGALLAVIGGFGGMRDHGGELSFAPRLPKGIERLAFPIVFRARLLHVEVNQEQAVYSLRAGDDPITISHWGASFEVTPVSPVVRAIPKAPRLRPPVQPAGRAPARRRLDA